MIDLSTEFGQKVKRHLENEYFIWFTTVGADLTPQPRPVWFIWERDSFLIFSKPEAYKVRHVKERPNVALHFNTDEKADEDVIVFLGVAEIDTHSSPPHEIPAYFEKYASGMEELGMTPETFSEEYSLAIRVRPTKLRGW
jgi:PPOX class probable F420-dependent enzyme